MSYKYLDDTLCGDSYVEVCKVFSIIKYNDGGFLLEDNETLFTKELTKEEFLEMLDELRGWAI